MKLHTQQEMSLYLLKYHKALSGFVIQPIIDASLLFNKINENICSYFVTSVFGLHFEANDAEKKVCKQIKKNNGKFCVCVFLIALHRYEFPFKNLFHL